MNQSEIHRFVRTFKHKPYCYEEEFLQELRDWFDKLIDSGFSVGQLKDDVKITCDFSKMPREPFSILHIREDGVVHDGNGVIGWFYLDDKKAGLPFSEFKELMGKIAACGRGVEVEYSIENDQRFDFKSGARKATLEDFEGRLGCLLEVFIEIRTRIEFS